MADFDKAGRSLIKGAPDGFLAWLSARFASAWAFRGWMDTSTLAFPGEPDRTCDTVAECVHVAEPSRRCLLDVEVQSRPHGDMLERQGEYAFRLRRERRYGRGRRGKYQVVSVLLNLTGPVQPHVLDMTEETLGGGLRLQVVQRTLREEDAASTLARIAAGELERCILPWVVLMREGGRADIIEEWRRLALQEPNRRQRGEYGVFALVFSELTRQASAWGRALEGWNVERSRHVMEWMAQAQQQALLRVLRARFPGFLPEDLETAIAQLNDPDELGRWLDAAATATSLDDFRAAVGR
jgi:hypothetical protein